MPIPVPAQQNFSITPMLNAYAVGQQSRQNQEDRQQAISAQIEERVVRGAEAADTPEKWTNFVGVLREQFPDADLSSFEPFEAREYALSQQYDPYQRAQLDIQQQQLALQQQAAAQAAAAANAPQPGFTPLTDPAQREAYGIAPDDTGIYQIGPDNRLYAIGGGGQTINVNTGGTSSVFGEQLAEALGGDFVDQRDAAMSAARTLNTNAEAQQLLDDGIITGFGANALVAFGNALSQVGIDLAPEARANTEAYISAMGRNVGEIIRLFGAGTGLSDADREYAAGIAAGNVTMNEEALRKIIDINNRAATNVINAYNEQAQMIEGAPGYAENPIVPFSLAVPLPGATQAAATPTVAPGPQSGPQEAPIGTRAQLPDGTVVVKTADGWEPQ